MGSENCHQSFRSPDGNCVHDGDTQTSSAVLSVAVRWWCLPLLCSCGNYIVHHSLDISWSACSLPGPILDTGDTNVVIEAHLRWTKGSIHITRAQYLVFSLSFYSQILSDLPQQPILGHPSNKQLQKKTVLLVSSSTSKSFRVCVPLTYRRSHNYFQTNHCGTEGNALIGWMCYMPSPGDRERNGRRV